MEFVFDNYNRATINLPILTQSDKLGNDNFFSGSEKRRNNGNLNLTFLGNNFENSGVPSQNQLNALDFIRNNQQELLNSFFVYTKEVLYPTHIGYIGYDEIDFPDIECVDDLRKSLGISDIYIIEECKDEISYVMIKFDFSGDYEHGTVLILHKSKILGWSEYLDDTIALKDMESNE